MIILKTENFSQMKKEAIGPLKDLGQEFKRSPASPLWGLLRGVTDSPLVNQLMGGTSTLALAKGLRGMGEVQGLDTSNVMETVSKEVKKSFEEATKNINNFKDLPEEIQTMLCIYKRSSGSLFLGSEYFTNIMREIKKVPYVYNELHDVYEDTGTAFETPTAKSRKLDEKLEAVFSSWLPVELATLASKFQRDTDYNRICT